MALSTNQVAGLASGFDWRTMIDQLMAIDHRRIDLVSNQKSKYEAQLSEWQAFNTNLLAFKTAAEGLKDPDDFYLFTTSMSTDSSTVDGDDLLSITTSTSAAPGTYTIKVTNLAQAQKLSSNPFTSKTAELGSSYAGDILINGTVITINSTDSLSDVAATINTANTGTDPSGVTASIVSYGTNDYRLILTSDTTGEDGISLLNGSSTNLVQKFGWKDNQAATVKNSVTEGAQSDRFTAQNVFVQSLLGLAAGEASTGTLTIDGTPVTINLATQSLTNIKDAINTAMAGAGKGSTIVASIVSETVDSCTYYRLQIEGTQTFADEKNILNTLGILDHTASSVSGKISGISLTEDGAYISRDTLLQDIDGYISYTAGDNIQMTGTQTGGGAVNYTFNISSTTTVGDLLDQIETQYATNSGDVIAYVTSTGKIRVDDVAGGGSLSVTLTDNITTGKLEFVAGDAAFGDGTARSREIMAGEDATLLVDGEQITSASNTIDNVIAGVTLKLKKEDSGTTVTLEIDRDIDTVKSNIENFVAAYNSVISYINTQFSYDEKAKSPGGVLFGDGTLRSVKADIFSIVNQTIWGVAANFSTMGLVGINVDNNMNLSIDDTKLTGYLQTHFNNIKSLFVGQGTTSVSTLSYIAHTRNSVRGEYTVHIHRAATRGTETGNVDLSGGGADETLTITKGNGTARIAITSGMTLDDIVHEINAELDQEYAETLVGDQQLQSGGSAITAQTKWGNITGTTLQDGDTISFTGTGRSGGTIAGSYTIGSVGSNSVQGFLTTIEDAFSSNVSASIDSSGRLVLTDKYVGHSQLSIDITEPSGRGLNFGTVDVTAGAGDGSQEGRYAITVTALNDGSNHLVLRNDDYGSGSFTISQDTSDTNFYDIIYTSTRNTTNSSQGTVDITSSTTWNDISGASLQNGDRVVIDGKKRDGSNFSTTYNYDIGDVTSDTVNGLLTAIETAYDTEHATTNKFDAFIQDGKIYVEDKSATGSSLIELTLTPSYLGGGSGLDLGTFDQATERDLDLGLINGTITGLDVAGTINGESATGSGRVLTGDEDNVNTEGISVRYTGSANNTSAGTVKLTIGVAALFERILYNITDSLDGYAAFKQDSLQDRISEMGTDIDEMEERLNKKMETMINQFVRMELALSKIQAQSSWLSGQINAAAGNWS